MEEGSMGRASRPWWWNRVRLEGRKEARVQVPGSGVWVAACAMLHFEEHCRGKRMSAVLRKY